jgi:hypothetical protein
MFSLLPHWYRCYVWMLCCDVRYCFLRCLFTAVAFRPRRHTHGLRRLPCNIVIQQYVMGHWLWHSLCLPRQPLSKLHDTKVTSTCEGGRVLDGSAHVKSRALVSQSTSVTCCILSVCLSLSLSLSLSLRVTRLVLGNCKYGNDAKPKRLDLTRIS